MGSMLERRQTVSPSAKVTTARMKNDRKAARARALDLRPGLRLMREELKQSGLAG
jgi:hypothetical protein